MPLSKRSGPFKDILSEQETVPYKSFAGASLCHPTSCLSSSVRNVNSFI